MYNPLITWEPTLFTLFSLKHQSETLPTGCCTAYKDSWWAPGNTLHIIHFTASSFHNILGVGTISQKMYNGHKQTLVGIDRRQQPQSVTEQCPIVVWLWGHKLLNSTHTLYYSTLSYRLLMVTNRRFSTIFSQYY